MSKKSKVLENDGRRRFLKGTALGTAALAAGAASPGLFSSLVGSAYAAESKGEKQLKMAFVQFMPHTVPAAWSKGIEGVLRSQPNVDYVLLDGQGKVEVQISLMDTLINEGVAAIFLQPVDSVAVGPSIAKAKRAGIPVITLNIDSAEKHAAHVEMSHLLGAKEIAKEMGARMGGKGKVVILNAPPGIIIRDMRTNGFLEGLKQHHPGIAVVADQSAEWSRKKAQDVFATMLAAHGDVTGVYGVNDSMALGAVDVAKQKSMLAKLVIFGNDGEKDALESIEKGELTGTQYTDVYQQGRFAAASATVLATGGVSAKSFTGQGRVLMPYVIATKETVGQIKPDQRW